MPGDDELIARLAQSDIFCEYQRAFRTTAGLPLVLQPAGSLRSPLNPFCALLTSGSPAGVASLPFPSWNEVGAAGATWTRLCPAGLIESAVPIRLGRRVLGFLRTGLVLLLPPSPARLQSLLRQMRGRSAGLAVAELSAAYFATRVMARPHYDSALRLLGIFAQHLALLGNQLMIAEIAAESRPVARARLFIAKHHGEELSLPDVARAVHMSPFYFCKVFKRETGLGFNVYLARTRVEKVKHLLLHRHTRITEAAFAAGFQSVSQFNRVFHHLVGESPSDYRHRLEAAPRTIRAGSRTRGAETATTAQHTAIPAEPPSRKSAMMSKPEKTVPLPSRSSVR